MRESSNFFKKIINIIIFLLFISIVVLGIYYLKECVLSDEEVAKMFQPEYDNVIVIQKENEIQNITNPIDTIETTYNKKELNSGKYYYEQLDEYGKLIYDKLQENKENMETGNYTIEFGKAFNELLNTENGEQQLNISYQSALDAYFLDNPDVFYIDVTKLYLLMNSRTIIGKTTYTVTIGGENGSNYYSEGFYNIEQVKQEKSKIEEIANNIIEEGTGTEFQKIKQIHNWLVENVSYDQTISRKNIRNVYGALEEKEVVCEGYAKAFKYLLDKAGIENIIVIGYGTNTNGESEEHAWNYIKLNEEWYATDVTWDDPIIQGGGTITDKIKYSYFLKGSKNFNKNHEVTGKTSQGGITFTYPEISYTDYN